VTALGSVLREKLSDISSVTTHDLGEKKCGIVTFTKTGIDPIDLTRHLTKNGINISVSFRRSAQLDLGRRNLSDLARASVHYFNTVDEIDVFCRAIEEA